MRFYQGCNVLAIILSLSPFGSPQEEEAAARDPSYYTTLKLNLNELRGSRWALQQSSKITVYFSIKVIDITKVDVDARSIRVEFFLRQRWTVAGLDIPDGLYKESDSQETYVSAEENVLKSVWSPDSFIPNAQDSKIASLNTANSVVNIYKNQTIVFKARMYSVLGCSFTFQWYPLDIQVCDLIFESYRYSDSVVSYQWEDWKEPVIVSNKIILYQYNLVCPPKLSKGVSNRWSGQNSYPYVKVRFKFERKLGNNLIQIFTPTILVTILSFFSFWLGLDAVPGRISLLVTCILTIVTMHSGLKGSIPPVHYIKMMDIWMIGCMCFIFGAICEFIVIKYLKWRNQHNKQMKEEQEKYWKDNGIGMGMQKGYPGPPPQMNIQNMMNNSTYPGDLSQHPYLQYLKNADETAGRNPSLPIPLTHSAQKRHAWKNSFGGGPPGMVPPSLHPGFPGDFAPGMINMHEVTIYDQPMRLPPQPPKLTPTWVQIDRVCRFLFPLLFAIFNGAYWPILLMGSAKQHKDK